MSLDANEIEQKYKTKIEVDLKKAKPGCKWCNGRGTRGYKSQGKNEQGQEILVPLICPCVVKRGGVTREPLFKGVTGTVRTGPQGPGSPSGISGIPEQAPKDSGSSGVAVVAPPIAKE